MDKAQATKLCGENAEETTNAGNMGKARYYLGIKAGLAIGTSPAFPMFRSNDVHVGLVSIFNNV